ncbi:hypothetical protein LSH36_14g08058 [Paralvinella palmiformis]|uniref:Uncharacterized protein n=1 Tax=Paralvinella palmiformis TaxID=53620 RepID=A0AAD9KCR5_9ANNE|nr:hypothetical protein LSH36_14g08058 [Paralvinella palmiformis]
MRQLVYETVRRRRRLLDSPEVKRNTSADFSDRRSIILEFVDAGKKPEKSQNSIEDLCWSNYLVMAG